MNRKIVLIITVIIASFFNQSCKDEYSDLKDGLYANIETSNGDILLKLEFEKAPITVANFVTLAEGKNPFVSKDLKGKLFFDGLSFHRVEPGFVIQSGDPIGNGAGDAGYTFNDEFCDLKHDSAGTLSMANSGPGTNSSQFFITMDKTPWLDGRHSVFGKVVNPDGMDVVKSIRVGDLINSVKIIRKGEAAKRFDAVKTFSDYFKKETENRKKLQALEEENKRIYAEKYKAVIEQKVNYFETLKTDAIKSTSGLKYVITSKSNGAKPKEGETVFIKYSGFLEDGTLFDTSSPEVAKQFGKYDKQRDFNHDYTLLPYQVGSNKLIPGFVEGVNKLKIGEKAILYIPSKLGYGEQGAGNVIPPNADIIFEIEITDKNK